MRHVRLPHLRRAAPCAHCLALEYKIAKLEPKDGDVLVLRIPKHHSDFEMQRLAGQLQDLAPNIATVVIRGDIDPAIARNLRLEELGVAGRSW